jgi:hypothetical protein
MGRATGRKFPASNSAGALGRALFPGRRRGVHVALERLVGFSAASRGRNFSAIVLTFVLGGGTALQAWLGSDPYRLARNLPMGMGERWPSHAARRSGRKLRLQFVPLEMERAEPT